MIPIENLIVTADDFGISLGVNQAIIKAHINGGLTNASLMVNANYLDNALQLARQQAPNLKLGLHINITTGKPVSQQKHIPHLLNKDGNFKYGPVSLLVQTLLNPHIMPEIEKEITAQIKKLQDYNVQINHFDGHHHVQMIPRIFKIVTNLAKKHNIQQLRIVNESLCHTLAHTNNYNFLFGSAIARYALLKCLCFCNNFKTDTYFFSILHSCKITPALIKNLTIPKNFKNIEIMLHPGDAAIDKSLDNVINMEKTHLASPYRQLELETALQCKKINQI